MSLTVRAQPHQRTLDEAHRRLFHLGFKRARWFVKAGRHKPESATSAKARIQVIPARQLLSVLACLVYLLGIAFCDAAMPLRAQSAGGTQRSVKDVTDEPSANAARSSYYALLIGIAEYKSLAHLVTPKKDAEALAKLLREEYGFQTKVLTDATRKQILDTLSSYRKSLPASSNLLIFFAGHGDFDTIVNETFWLPADASPGADSDWMSAADIARAVKGIASDHILIISDSCYAGAMFEDDTLHHRVPPELQHGIPTEYEALLSKLQQLRSRDLITSGSKEPVLDGGAPGHSIFAAAVLKELHEIDLPRFAASDLFSRVRLRVGGRSRQLPQFGRVRDSGDDLGDFVFSRSHPSQAIKAASAAEGTVQETEAQKALREELAKSYQQEYDLAANNFHAALQRDVLSGNSAQDLFRAHEQFVQAGVDLCSVRKETDCAMQVYQSAVKTAHAWFETLREGVIKGGASMGELQQVEMHETEMKNLLLRESALQQ